MNKFRRIGAMVAATVAATGMAMTATSAPAVAAPKANGPTAVWSFLQSQDENSGRWQSVWFRTDVKACNFKLRVNDIPGVDITHPWGWPFTSLHNDSTLKKNETDFASFYVKTGPTYKSTWRYLPAWISYDNCKTGKKKVVSAKWTAFVLPVRNTGM
ncbi:hypothetical protein [Actinoplanes sp. NPDC049265]|uniref:hypothetical protein n=1 Tax=Actinoplanes sp. NPDC049265 TaxID=3363902 RepID=UPI003720F14B